MGKRYDLILDSAMGLRRGSLELSIQGKSVTGTLCLLGRENPVSGQMTGRRTLSLKHTLRTGARDLSCRTQLRLSEDGRRLDGYILVPQGAWPCVGTLREREDRAER